MINNVIDMHVHVAPCVDPRSQSADEVVDHAVEAGFAGVVFKASAFDSATIAAMVTPTEPSFRVAGGVVLNRSVGGINPAAVEAMLAMRRTDGFQPGRVVWMPTRHSDDHLALYPTGERPVRLWQTDLSPRDELIEVLKLIADNDAVLATGHLGFEQSLRLIALARRLGVDRIVQTHADVGPVSLTIEQQKSISQTGAYIEHCYASFFVGPGAKEERLRKRHGASLAQVVDGIRATGADRCVLSSDFGAAEFGAPVDGMVQYLQDLAAQGILEEELTVAASINPAELLGWR